MRRLATACAVLGAFALIAAACGSESSSNPAGGGSNAPSPAAYSSNLQGEGELNLIAWQGYTEDDWVKPFEQETGCKVTVKYANTSDDMVNFMRQGGGTLYDGVSASGDATNRLIANGDVAPIDVNSFSAYANVMQTLQAPPHNTVNGVHYGVPYMWGPNFLMWNTDVVQPAPDSWSVTWDPSSPYAGKVTAYDSPIFIADAAMYLMSTQPDLGITDPYLLTDDQLNAAVTLLKQQSQLVGKYWAYYLDEIKGFNSGDMVVGTAWPVNYQYIADPALGGGKVKVDWTIPKEGVTGWADTWMMSSHAPHPNCMLQWMEYSLRPDVQVQVAEFYGATPSNTASCAQLNKDLGSAAEAYHCGDDQFLSSVYLWKTPTGQCPDGSTGCTDYNDWTAKWLEVRGGGG
jgi:putative spermidine/putrescine transport system substrate-binding protein